MPQVGQVFGRLTVLQATSQRRSHSIVWVCLCVCGSSVEVSGTNLNAGTKSCGCLQRELLAKRSVAAAKHGHMRGNAPSSTYQTWKNVLQRCTNPRHSGYRAYGGAGIGVDPSWLIFENFLADMGERPAGYTLDRLDNTRGYVPGN